MAPKATLGRIVMFNVSTESAGKLNMLGGKKYNVGDQIPGIVVRTGDNNICNLTLFPDAHETLYQPGVTFSTGNQPGTWNWPERVEEAKDAAA